MSDKTADKSKDIMDKLKSSLDDMYQEFSLPESLRDEYKVISCLSSTNVKSVYLVEEITSKTKYIMKCATGKGRALLANEYKILTAIDKDFLPRAVLCVEEEDVTYFVREYIVGDTLEQMLDKYGPFELDAAANIMDSICNAVKFLHGNEPPLVHRDIKPQNIICTKQGACKFIDFDTAREYKQDEGYDTVFMGTRQTAAPEQFGYQQTSARTDIYSLGVLFLYLLTGQYDMKCKEWDSLSGKSQKVISKCMAFDPKDRYSSVDRLIKDLRSVRHEVKSSKDKIKDRAIIFLSITCAFLCMIVIFLLVDRKDEIDVTTADTESLTDTESLPNAESLTETELADTGKAIRFNEPVIEAAVRCYLGKSEDEPIYQSDLNKVTSLIICGEEVFVTWDEHETFHANRSDVANAMPERATPLDLSDLQYMPNITELVLDNQGLEDVRNIADMPLVKLNLQRNNIEDITALMDNTSIVELNLSHNPIYSIDGINQMTGLRRLYLSYTKINDISVLANMPLTLFECVEVVINDLSVLETLKHLEVVRFTYMTKDQIVYLNSLTKLSGLGLYDSDLESLEELDGLTNLDSLDVSGCEYLTSLEGIEEFERLSYLGIGSTGITDISPLVDVDTLFMLDMAFSPVEDLSYLEEFTRLDTVFIDPSKESDIEKLQLRINVVVY